MPPKKYYAVWEGHNKGLFENWADCKKAVDGYIGAKYKSFTSKDEAQKALEDNPYKHIGKNEKIAKSAVGHSKTPPATQSIAVDAACNMVSGEMEYQGVYSLSGELIFKMGPFSGASNNIGEFLALVHALAWCKAKGVDLPIYSDSKTAIAWVRNKKARTTVTESNQNIRVFDLITRAENWLKTHTWTNKILKWDTENWGEIPADYGRK